MGKTHSRRGANAASAAETPRKRRRDKRARTTPGRAFPGDVATGSPCGNAITHNKPARGAGAGLQSVQAEPAAAVRSVASGDLRPKTWIPTEPVPAQAETAIRGDRAAGASSASSNHTPVATPAPAIVPTPDVAPDAAPAPDLPPRLPGPSFRQDIPRPPLRYGALVARRRARLFASRLVAGLARAVAYIVACLDAYLWQPALWPFRRKQRELLARTLAVLSVALVAVAWIAAYHTLAPADAARPLAAPAATPQPKQVTARVVSHALPRAAVPAAAVPLPVPAPHRRRPARDR